MGNNFTLEAAPLFNSAREPWYKCQPRNKKADTLGYLKHPDKVEHDFYEGGLRIYA